MDKRVKHRMKNGIDCMESVPGMKYITLGYVILDSLVNMKENHSHMPLSILIGSEFHFHSILIHLILQTCLIHQTGGAKIDIHVVEM